MSNMLRRTLITVTIVSLCLLVLLLMTTTPATAGPLGLLVIFISAYLTSLGVMSFFLYGASRLFSTFFAGFATKKPLQPLSLRKSYYYATVVATAPVMLIGLQSVGAVGFYEVGLIILFVIIGCVYISRRTG
jgi:hypothetical protein